MLVLGCGQPIGVGIGVRTRVNGTSIRVVVRRNENKNVDIKGFGSRIHVICTSIQFVHRRI